MLNEVYTKQHADKCSRYKTHGQRIFDAPEVDVYQIVLNDEANQKVEIDLD